VESSVLIVSRADVYLSIVRRDISSVVIFIFSSITPLYILLENKELVEAGIKNKKQKCLILKL
jgi:hypothetical protein